MQLAWTQGRARIEGSKDEGILALQAVRTLGAIAGLLTGTLLAGSSLRAEPTVEAISAAAFTSSAASPPGVRAPGRLPLATARGEGPPSGSARRSLLQLEQPLGERSELHLRLQPKAKRLVVLELRF